MRVVLLTPPLVQLNTPYPATAYLARTLRAHGHTVEQRDLGIELVSKLLTRGGISAVFDAVAELEALPEPAWEALARRRQHEGCVEAVARFLRGEDRTLAWRLREWPSLLPPTPRLETIDEDTLSVFDLQDAARHVASLYVADLADLVTATLDPGFGVTRYQHHLATGPVTFDPIQARLEETTLLDAWLDGWADDIAQSAPDLVGISLPFPGTLVAGLRIGRRLKRAGVPVLLGGGYVSTELREVDEPRLWSCADALVYDDGDGPLLAWLAHQAGGADRRHRTRTPEGLLDHAAPRPEVVPVADYEGLDLSPYLQILHNPNPAHRLWTDGRWNKATLAHGCYWKRCAFCDVNLDYVARYEPSRVSRLVDAMQQVTEETGQTGFHLVDEAAPPKLLRDLALELLRRDLGLTWWGNIRFESSFTPDLCRLLAHAGLVMVTGGLEVASDRLLRLMDKGITVDQAARACASFRDAGVMVHAYLMYGFPTQTLQETVDAAEVVRQLFAEGLLTSAFWHRFVLTRHSRVYAEPERYGVSFTRPEGVFATNDLPHEDPTGVDPDPLDTPLVTSLAAWMQGEGLDQPADAWFPRGTPKPAVAPDAILHAIDQPTAPPSDRARMVWLGQDALATDDGAVVVFGAGGAAVEVEPRLARGWPEIEALLEQARPDGQGATWATFREAVGEKRWRRWWPMLHHAGLVAAG